MRHMCSTSGGNGKTGKEFLHHLFVQNVLMVEYVSSKQTRSWVNTVEGTNIVQ